MARKAGVACVLLQWGMECINHVYHMIQISEIRGFLLCLEINHYFTPSQPQCLFKWLAVAADTMGRLHPALTCRQGDLWAAALSEKASVEGKSQPNGSSPLVASRGVRKKALLLVKSEEKKINFNTKRLRLKMLQVGWGRDHSWPNKMVKEDEL